MQALRFAIFDPRSSILDPRLLRLFGHVDELARSAAGAAAQLALTRLGRRRRRGRRRLLDFLPLGVEALATQTDLALARIHAQDLHLDVVADLDDVLRRLDLV